MEKLRRLYDRALALGRFLTPMHISLYGAYTTFFLILSLFPCMLLLLGLLKFTSLGVQDLMRFLEGLLPQALLPVAEALVDASFRHSSGTVVSVSAAAALWSASRGMRGLVLGLNAVYGSRERRGYLGSRTASMGYTLIFLLALVGTLVAQGLLSGLADYLLMTTRPGLLRLLSGVDVQMLGLLVLLSGIFSAMYAWLPARRNTFRRSLPGGVLAAVGWLGSAKAFSVYLTYFTRYTNIFGSLYGLALGMLWLYWCCCLIFFGGAFNRLLFEKKEGT